MEGFILEIVRLWGVISPEQTPMGSPSSLEQTRAVIPGAVTTQGLYPLGPSDTPEAFESLHDVCLPVARLLPQTSYHTSPWIPKSLHSAKHMNDQALVLSLWKDRISVVIRARKCRTTVMEVLSWILMTSIGNDTGPLVHWSTRTLTIPLGCKAECPLVELHTSHHDLGTRCAASLALNVYSEG